MRPARRPASATRCCPASRAEGIQLLRWDQAHRRRARRARSGSSTTKVFPVLTPLAVDPAHPFPYISGLSLNLAVVVRNPGTGTELFARVKVPPLPAALRRRSARQRFVPLEDVIAAHLRRPLPRHGDPAAPHLPGHPQRGRRGRGGRRREPAQGARARAHAPPVRAARAARGRASRSTRTCSSCWSASSASPSEEVFRLPGPLDLTGLWTIYGLDRDDLKERQVPAEDQPRS